MSFDLVTAMEFLHQLTGKLIEFTNAELLVLGAGSLLTAKVIEHSKWFKTLLRKVGYLK